MYLCVAWSWHAANLGETSLTPALALAGAVKAASIAKAIKRASK